MNYKIIGSAPRSSFFTERRQQRFPSRSASRNRVGDSEAGYLSAVRAVLGLGLCLGSWAIAVTPAQADEEKISCLGRLEPGLGIVHLASPSVGGGVIASLHVSEGDWVDEGQLLATLDDHALRSADVARLQAELSNAKREEERAQTIFKRSAASAATLDAAVLRVRVAEANLAAARARLELTQIRAPIQGQILEIHTRPGERVGEDGFLEMGDTKRMMAVAEVYETDIGSVQQGKQARVTSPALEEPLTGSVDIIALKIGRMDVLGTDPIAKTDARVVEVRVKLDSSEAVERLTNLQVEIEIDR